MDIHSVYRVVLRPFRRRRMERFSRDFAITNSTVILDVGGTSYNWQFVRAAPRVIRLNLSMEHSDVVADARSLPFKDKGIDVIFCNSVIEHVHAQQRMADEIERVGRRYFVQTPARSFPIEPHYLTPFFHWLPKNLQRRLIRNFTVYGWIQRPSKSDCMAMVAEIQLLTKQTMRTLFPRATLRTERFGFLTKALIAERR